MSTPVYALRNSRFKTAQLLLPFLFLLFSTSSLWAQEDFTPKFGTVDKAAFEVNATRIDSTADAIVLYDHGDVHFGYDDKRGFIIYFKYWGRIKILKESALDRASVAIPIRKGNYQTEEALYDIAGYTHNWDGATVKSEKMERKTIAKEASSDETITYKFNLPNVKKGSIIEYTYTKSTPFVTQDKPDTWIFQGSIPFQWSEYQITIPDFLYYKINMGGYLPLYINKKERVNFKVGVPQFDGAATAYRFVVKDAPAFFNEPFITSSSDYLAKISLELSNVTVPGYINKSYSQTWENVDKTLLEATWFGGQLKRWSFIKDAATTLGAKATTPEQKMREALAFTQATIKWNDYFGIGSRDGVKKAYDNRKGNSSDINLFLVSLLRELGLDANPVVLSTRNNGRLNEFIPLLERFNYVVAHVKDGEKEYLLDGCQPYLPLGMLPEHALNQTGRLVSDKTPGRFINLDPVSKKTTFETVEGEIDVASGEIKGKYKLSLGGYGAVNWRNEYATTSTKKYQEEIVKQNPEWEINDVKIENINDSVSNVVNILYDFVVEDQDASPNVIYFNPMMAGRIKDHPLKNPERIYPLDLTTGSHTLYQGKFKIPEGYKVEEMPKSEIISLPDKAGRFIYSVTLAGDMLNVNSNLSINKIRFEAEEYHYLREFFDKIVQKHAQPVIIRKQN